MNIIPAVQKLNVVMTTISGPASGRISRKITSVVGTVPDDDRRTAHPAVGSRGGPGSAGWSLGSATARADDGTSPFDDQ